jgi:hypothetical protein
MKLSARTIQILKSFSLINPSIVFDEGNTIKTISPTKTVMAKATVPDNFTAFAIYDLSRFIGVLSLFKEPELEFNGKIITIKGNSGESISYTCADPSNIVTPPSKDIKLPSEDVNFTLEEEVFGKTQKALSVLGLPEFAVVGDGTKIYLQAVDSKNPTSDIYKVEVGETDLTFRAIFKSDNLKIIPGKYDVTISSKGLSCFVGDDVTFWIATEASSNF